MTKLIDIEGIGASYAVKLNAKGIKSVEALLKEGATPKGRKDLAASTGINEKLILTWVNHADLFRIKGIGGQYSDLLEAAGVDTVTELATRKAANLHAKLVAANEEKNLVRRAPTLKEVEGWIVQAKSLPRAVKY